MSLIFCVYFKEYWAAESGDRLTIGAVAAVVSINVIIGIFIYISLNEK